MTADIDREKLRELCERATPGPWLLTDDGLKVYALHHNGDYRKGQPVLVNRMYMQIDPCLAQGGSIAEAKAACRLIAAARTALPALLNLTDAQAAKITKLEERASDLQSILSDMEGVHERAQMAEIENAELKTDIASLESERGQLRKQVEGQFIAGMRKAAEIANDTYETYKACSDWDYGAQNACVALERAILSAASALEQKEQG